MRVAKKIMALREGLRSLPKCPDCKSFAGTPLYELGQVFFPGSLGICDEQRESVSTIVLGSDWGNEQTFKGYLKREFHEPNISAAVLDAMLTASGFDPADCFYSNAWPVMRPGAAKEEGPHPLREDCDLTAACRRYLQDTLDTLGIKLVISLGNPCAWFVAPFYGAACRLNTFDSPRRVRIRDLPEGPFVRDRDSVVFVHATHPARLVNRKQRTLHLRSYGGSETKLLITARRWAGIPDAARWRCPPSLAAHG